MSGNAIAVRTRQSSTDDSSSWRHRIAAAMSSANTRVITAFAFAGAWLYPVLHCPVIEQFELSGD
jgi:protein involved in ribonucleotide reduction